MAVTPIFQLPYPDASSAAFYTEFQTFCLAVDSALSALRSESRQHISATVTASDALPSNRPVLLNVDLSSSTSSVSTLDAWALIDRLVSMILAHTQGVGEFALPLLFGAYEGAAPAIPGATTTIYQDRVRIKNEHVTVSGHPGIPGVLHSDGSIRPYTLSGPKFPFIFPIQTEYGQAIRGGGDVDPEAVEIPPNTRVTGRRGYYGCAVDNTLFVTAQEIIINVFQGVGTFTIWGLDNSEVPAVVSEEVAVNVTADPEDILDGDSTPYTTVGVWTRFLGATFAGATISPEYAAPNFDEDVCIFSLSSHGGANQFSSQVVLARHPLTVNPDLSLTKLDDPRHPVTNLTRDPEFYACVECSDWSGSITDMPEMEVGDIPLVGFFLASKMRTRPFLFEDLTYGQRVSGLTDEQCRSALEDEYDITDALSWPVTWQPIYVVGTNTSGVATTWTITPEALIDFSEVSAPFPRMAQSDIFSTEPDPEEARDGMTMLMKVEFPTNIRSVTAVLWGATDPEIQYQRFYAMPLPIPIGYWTELTAPGAVGTFKFYLDSLAVAQSLLVWLGAFAQSRYDWMTAPMMQTLAAASDEGASASLLNTVWIIMSMIRAFGELRIKAGAALDRLLNPQKGDLA